MNLTPLDYFYPLDDDAWLARHREYLRSVTPGPIALHPNARRYLDRQRAQGLDLGYYEGRPVRYENGAYIVGDQPTDDPWTGFPMRRPSRAVRILRALGRGLADLAGLVWDALTDDWGDAWGIFADFWNGR